MNKRPVLITGSPRSGTSMTAGVCFYLGIYLGDYFLKRNNFCPTGFFENMEFCDLDHKCIDSGQKETIGIWKDHFKKLVKRYSEMEVYGFERWGWKTPSATHFLDEIVKICNPQIIWVYREKEGNVASLQKMQWVTVADEIFEDKEKQRKYFKDKYDIHFVKYEDILDKTEIEIGKIIGYLGINPSQNKIDKATRHVIKKLDISVPKEKESYLNYL